ncbi:MAG: type 2 isopentenyl-diphosphate Delta-isomerase [Geitlerinemataceae cyanobacterium]
MIIAASDNPARETQAHETQAHETQARKADHLKICLEDDVNCREVTTGFDRYRFEHCCLPELDFADIAIETTFLGKKLAAPLLISSMTGGTDRAKTVNFRLAEAAQNHGIAMGVGSQRVAIENPELNESFAVRKVAPDALLFANVGAVQFNFGYGIDEFRRAVDNIEADALILHLNPLQECVQTRGDRNFANLLDRIAELCDVLPVPVIAKEVGNGISGKMARKLLETGVAAINVAGAGGTSWAKVESERAIDPIQRRVGRTFADWGIPTAECLRQVRAVSANAALIASGGLKTGLDAAIAIALGADLAGMATPFLKAADASPEQLDEMMQVTIAELKTAMMCSGCGTLADLRNDGVLVVR